MKVLLLSLLLLISAEPCFADTPAWDVKNNVQPILQVPMDTNPIGLLVIGVPIILIGLTVNQQQVPAGAFYFFGGVSVATGIALIKW